MDTTPPIIGTASATAAPSGSDKIWAVLSHLSFFLGVPFLLPLVVYLVMKNDSEYAAANAREALNFHITVLIYGICCVLLSFIFIGIPLAIIIGICSLVLAVIGAVKASDGLCYHYPMTLRLV